MGYVIFNTKELDIISKAIENYKPKIRNNPDFINKLEKAEKKIKLSRFSVTSSNNKALLIASIKGYLNYPQEEELFALSEYEIFIANDKMKDLFKEMDFRSNLINKFKREKDRKDKIFGDVFKKMEQLQSLKEVCYSEMHDGKIYKIGIIGNDGKGLKMEVGSTNIITDLKIEEVYPYWFGKKGTPMDVIQKLELYGAKNKLNKSQVQAKEILRKMI